MKNEDKINSNLLWYVITLFIFTFLFTSLQFNLENVDLKTVTLWLIDSRLIISTAYSPQPPSDFPRAITRILFKINLSPL